MKYQVNEGPVDRIVRVIVGITLLGVALTGAVAAPAVFLVLVLSAIGLITGVTGFCPTYVLLGVSTLGRDAPAE